MAVIESIACSAKPLPSRAQRLALCVAAAVQRFLVGSGTAGSFRGGKQWAAARQRAGSICAMAGNAIRPAHHFTRFRSLAPPTLGSGPSSPPHRFAPPPTR
jgi:hypothetical protein